MDVPRHSSSFPRLVSMPDPFDGFAEECGLRLTAESLSVAPRDVLAPISQAEQHFLVTLSRQDVDADGVRLIFVTPLTSSDPPQIRDVLWWTASDAWMLEEGKREIDVWAAAFGYPAGDAATVRLFKQQTEQADSLINLLGEFQYRRLLDLYGRESSPAGVAPDPAPR
jgi:hypothetical protein